MNYPRFLKTLSLKYKSGKVISRHKNEEVYVLFLLMFILLSGVFVYSVRAEIGNMTWASIRNPEMALFWNPSPLLAHNIGNYYFNGGAYNLGLAEKYFKVELTHDPNARSAWHQLARIDFLRGNFTRARDDINKQIAIHSDTLMSSYYVRALINGYSGHLDEAATDFTFFLEKKPDSWAARNDLAWIYFQKGDFKNVETAARTGLTYHPDNPWLLTSLGVALLNLDKKDEAKKTLEKAKAVADGLTIADWGKAYPGNDPKFYGEGLEKMKKSIEFNLELASS